MKCSREKRVLCSSDKFLVTSQQKSDNSFSINPSIDSVLVINRYATHDNVSVNDGSQHDGGPIIL
jgi:hypothetical protein